jgi:hypothetical protein
MDMESVEEETKMAAGSLIQTAVTDFKDIYRFTKKNQQMH